MGAFISFFKSEAPTARTGRHVNPEGEAKRSKDSLVFLSASLQGANRFIRLCELFLREREKRKLGANELAFRYSPPIRVNVSPCFRSFVARVTSRLQL